MMVLIWKQIIPELSCELALVMDPILEADFLRNATNGFNKLFENDIVNARVLFNGRNDPFHQLGLGVCAFLEAALGMEVSLHFHFHPFISWPCLPKAHAIEEANRCLTLAEAGTRKFTKLRKHVENHRFHPGVEWEILNADTVILLGLLHALRYVLLSCSTSIVAHHPQWILHGLSSVPVCLVSPAPVSPLIHYFQIFTQLVCLCPIPSHLISLLSSAHSKFSKLYKTVFPNGIDAYLPSPPPMLGIASRQSSFAGSVSYSSASSAASSTSTLPAVPESEPDLKLPISQKRSLFSRLTSGSNASTPALTATHHRPHLHPRKPDGPVDDLVIAGTAFGYGLFNLVFSLLPKRIQQVKLLSSRWHADTSLGTWWASSVSSMIESLPSRLLLLPLLAMIPTPSLLGLSTVFLFFGSRSHSKSGLFWWPITALFFCSQAIKLTNPR